MDVAKSLSVWLSLSVFLGTSCSTAVKAEQDEFLERLEKLEQSLLALKKETTHKAKAGDKKAPVRHVHHKGAPNLEQRIEEIEKSLIQLKQEALAKKNQPPHQPQAVPVKADADKTPELEAPNGFFFRLGGRVKTDGVYDIGPQGNIYGLDPTTIPLKGVDSAAHNKGHFNAGVPGSRLYVEAKKKFCDLNTRAYIEIDMNKDSSTTTTAYSPRTRHVYVEIENLLVGQTWYTFQDLDAFGRTVDNLYGGSRQAQIRYTHKFTPNVKLAMSLEKPDTEYIDSTDTHNDNSGFGSSRFPDFLTQLRWDNWDNNDGHIAFATAVRHLRVHISKGTKDSRVNYEKGAVGWGFGFTGRYNFWKKSGFFWQVNGGRGIDHYIDGDSMQDLYVQYPTTSKPTLKRRLKTLPVMNYIAGFELWLTDKLSFNAIGSITKNYKIKHMADVPHFDRFQQRYIGNMIYRLLPNTDIGFEVLHYVRTSGTKKRHSGHDTRISFTLNYLFDTSKIFH